MISSKYESLIKEHQPDHLGRQLGSGLLSKSRLEDFRGSRMSLTMSRQSTILSSSALSPQQEVNQMAQVTKQRMNRWQVDLGAFPRSTQVGLSICILWLKLSFLGRALEAILHRSILTLSSASIFHSFFQSASLRLLEVTC